MDPNIFDFNTWQAVIDHWPDGVILLDKHGVILSASKAATTLLGWKEGELQNHEVHQMLCSELRAWQHTADECPLTSARYQAAGNEYKDGVWNTKEYAYFYTTYRLLEITPEKTAASRILMFQHRGEHGYSFAESHKLSTLTEINPTPLLEIDKEGLIQFSNPVMTDLLLEFGFNDKGQSLVLPADLSDIVSRCLTEKKKISNIDTSIDGQFFLWSFFPIVVEESESVLVCGLNISDKKRAEQQQEEMKLIIEQEKEKARQEYVAKMVHELRSPLNSVVGCADILHRRLQGVLDKKQKELFTHIIQGGRRLAEQISHTLELSKVDAAQLTPHFQKIDLRDIVAELQNSIEPLTINKGLSYNVHLTESPIYLYADRQQVKQILLNIIANAIKYTLSGSVSLTTTIVDDNDLGACVAVAVQDTGCGITDQERQSIFKLFSRQQQHAESNIEGHGLGLTIANDFTTLHGGKIDLYSSVGKGSTFTVVLPLLREQQVDQKLP